MERLRKQLDDLVAALPDAAAVRARVDEVYSVYPFNEFEYVIAGILLTNCCFFCCFQNM
jgi:hypothetical protein